MDRAPSEIGAAAAPACFSSVRWYARWCDADKRSGEKARGDAGVCTDCLPSYQMRMKRQGRCERPQTVFRFEVDGSIVGVLA